MDESVFLAQDAREISAMRRIMRNKPIVSLGRSGQFEVILST